MKVYVIVESKDKKSKMTFEEFRELLTCILDSEEEAICWLAGNKTHQPEKIKNIQVRVRTGLEYI